VIAFSHLAHYDHDELTYLHNHFFREKYEKKLNEGQKKNSYVIDYSNDKAAQQAS